MTRIASDWTVVHPGTPAEQKTGTGCAYPYTHVCTPPEKRTMPGLTTVLRGLVGSVLGFRAASKFRFFRFKAALLGAQVRIYPKSYFNKVLYHGIARCTPSQWSTGMEYSVDVWVRILGVLVLAPLVLFGLLSSLLLT